MCGGVHVSLVSISQLWRVDYKGEIWTKTCSDCSFKIYKNENIFLSDPYWINNFLRSYEYTIIWYSESYLRNCVYIQVTEKWKVCMYLNIFGVFFLTSKIPFVIEMYTFKHFFCEIKVKIHFLCYEYKNVYIC